MDWRRKSGATSGPTATSSSRPIGRRAFALSASAALCSPILAGEPSNPRWDFLRANLSVFPGAEALFEPDERLFWRLKPNLRDAPAAERLPESEWPFRVSTDADGRRRTPSVDADETALFLGDSCTFGIPVEDDEAYPAVVQSLISGLRAVNAGVPGYSAFQGRKLLEVLGPALRPRVVVFAFWVNDRTVWDHLSDAEHEELLAAERAGEFSRHRLTRLLRRAAPGDRPRLNDGEFADETRRAIELSREVGARPLIAIWPTGPQVSGGDVHPRQRLLRETAQSAGAAVADLAPALRASGRRDLFVDPVHATRDGYRLAGEALAPFVRLELARSA